MKFRSLCSILFLSACLYSQQKTQNKLYSSLEISSALKGYSASAQRLASSRQEEQGELLELKTGANIIPSGVWLIVIRKKGYFPYSNQITLLPGVKQKIEAKLKEKPFTLKIGKPNTPYTLFMNKKKLLTADKSITITNLPGGKYSFVLQANKKFKHFFADSALLPPNRVFTVKSPRLRSPAQSGWTAAFMGLIPGLNYFYHFPESFRGPSIAASLLIYLQTAVLIASHSFDLRLNNPAEERIGTGIIITTIILSTIANFIFNYFGAFDDFSSRLETHTGLKLRPL